MKKIKFLVLAILCSVFLLSSVSTPIYAENSENDNSFTISLSDTETNEKIFEDGSSITIEDITESGNARAGLTITGKKISAQSSCGRLKLSFYIDTKAYMANDDPENPIYYTKINNYYGRAITVVAGTYRLVRFEPYNLIETANNPAQVALAAHINANLENFILQDEPVFLYATIRNGYLTVSKEGF